jgi:amino acid permease
MIYLFVGLFTWLGAKLLIRTGEKVNIFEYSDLSDYLLGTVGKWIIAFGIILGNFGCYISYIILVALLISSVLESWATSSFYTSPIFVLFFVVPLVTPLCMIRHFGNLRIFAIISILFAFTAVIFVSVEGPIEKKKYPNDEVNAKIEWLNWSGMFEAVGIVVFAFSFCTASFPAYKSLYPPNPSSMDALGAYGICCGSVFYLAMGLAGYLSFRDSTESNIFSNFSGPVADVLKIIISIQLISYDIPNGIVIMMLAMYRFLEWNAYADDSDTVTDIVHMILTAFVLFVGAVVAALMLAYTSNAFALCLNITGGVTQSIVTFTLPGLLAVVAYRDSIADKAGEAFPDDYGIFYFYAGVCLSIFGMSVMIISILSLFL